MKTNVNVTRKLQDFDVVQRTKDSMFNATILLNQWNASSGQQKKMIHYTENASTQEFINALLMDINSKERNSVLIQSRGKKGGTWMHPYLFIDFAMWLNPSFKLQVIKFVYDQLIEDRKLAGDYYNKLCSSLARYQDTDFREVGKILNFVVFNKHSKDLRNYATPEQQNDLQQLTRDLVKYIDMGFIFDFKSFKDVARKEWYKRHNNCPSVLL